MNSLFDTLLKTDAAKADEKATCTYYSARLAQLTGSKEPVAITLQEISYNRLNELITRQVDKKGNVDYKRAARSKSQVAVEGIVDPDLTNSQLLDHFHCFSPADLAEKLFSMELYEISDRICKLSGFMTDEEEIEQEAEEIKN